MASKIMSKSTLAELIFYYPSIFSESNLEIIPEENEQKIDDLLSYEDDLRLGGNLIFLCSECGVDLKDTKLFAKRICAKCATHSKENTYPWS